MPDKDRLTDLQFVANPNEITRVVIERRVARGTELRGVGLPVPNVVEQNYAVVLLERGYQQTPHVLIAAVAMSQHHHPGTRADNPDVVALQYIHPGAPSGTKCLFVMIILGDSARSVRGMIYDETVS